MTPRREPGLDAKPCPAKAGAEPAVKEEVRPKEELTGKVELKKEGGVLGLTVVGGADTALVGRVGSRQ